MKILTTLSLFLGILLAPSLIAQSAVNNRVIILTDIEADPDDTQSLVRLLLYANEIDIKGLVATTSCWQKTKIAPESITKVLKAYGKVQPNLLLHHPDYPAEADLQKLVKNGLPLYGMLGVGEDKDSEGSDWILQELEADDERPLWISVWGGVNTLAQTLHKIRATKSKKEAARLIAKLRVYTISDQDDSGVWIRKNFPDLFYIVSPGDHYNGSTWNGIMSRIEGIDNRTLSNTWLAKNIQQGHGPLGAEYPDVAWGMEGDTPAFLSLIHNGLNDTDHPEWGAWGGRYELYTPDFAQQKQGHSGVPFEAETRPIWTNANDKYSPYVANEYGRNVRKESLTFEDNKASLWRWRDDFQNDFAARMDWCLASYKDANHAPVPMLQHSDQITLKSGEKFTLDASNSTDPDGDNLSFLWFQYPEEGSYKELIPNGAAENIHTYYIQAPEVEKAETVHYILKVTDKGSPAISRYRRIIVTVLPK